jgi:parallel beta-helix repeat protein
MKVVRLGLCSILVSSLVTVLTPVAATAATITVRPGDSIQAAVDAAAPGDTIKVFPGDYTETHGNDVAVHITKSIKLIAKSRIRHGVRVRLQPGPGNTQGIKVEPANPGDPDIVGLKIQGFTVQGFHNNGIWLRHVSNYTIDGNEAVDNLENGIWPTLSANGKVRNNVAYGSQDSALWIEASENVRALNNDLSTSPTGLEITISKNIVIQRNNIHDNTVGVGLYHPNAAGLPNPYPTYAELGDWNLRDNHIHDNNAPNTAPSGSLSSGLPSGIGILVLGVDNNTLYRNQIENNGFSGIALVDWCVGAALAGPSFACNVNPALTESAPDNDHFLDNGIVGNGTAPPSGFEALAADISQLPGAAVGNCFSGNTPTATVFPAGPLPPC